MPGPLHGIRVIEVANVLLGPWACQILADMGADVIKVEPPEGDRARRTGPHKTTENMGALFLGPNRNKRSVVIDLASKLGRDSFLKLTESADVLVHNLRPQMMAHLGLDYAALSAVNPDIIYASACGYGQTGPYAERSALEDAMQAACGLVKLNERIFGEPRYTPTAACEKTTALMLVCGILSAVYHRTQTGEGQEVQVPMMETMVGYLMIEHLWGKTFDPPQGHMGYKGSLSAGRRPAATKDGFIAILTYLDPAWDNFCNMVDRPDLLADPRFKSLAERIRHIDDVYAETAKIMATKTTAEWEALFKGTSMPYTIVNTLEDLAEDPHLKAVGFWKSAAHPTEGKLRWPGFPVNYSDSLAEDRRPAPRLGEHSTEILREAGFSEAEIEAMLADGTTAADPAVDNAADPAIVNSPRVS